jgi:hypothetical protein
VMFSLQVIRKFSRSLSRFSDSKLKKVSSQSAKNAEIP